MNENYSQLIAFMERYLRGELTGRQAVHEIDDFVSSDKVYDLPEPLSAQVLELQDSMAMYVADPTKRAEHPGYFGDEGLREALANFMKQMGN